MVSEKVRSAHLPERRRRMAGRRQSRLASDQAAKAIRSVLAVLRDEDAVAIIERTIVARIAEPEWGPPAGRILAELLDEGRHLPLMDLMADRAHGWVEANPATIDRWVREKAPTWAPQFVNELLSDRAYRELSEWTWQIKVDKQHPVRLALIGFVEDFARDLQHDPSTMAKLEIFKHEVMNRDEVRRAAGSAWAAAKRMIVEATEDPLDLRVKIDDLLRRLADTRSATGRSETVGRLRDPHRPLRGRELRGRGHLDHLRDRRALGRRRASDKIELLAGKDLQFIRINGTAVGALAGSQSTRPPSSSSSRILCGPRSGPRLLRLPRQSSPT